jgi:hypothetical protein
MEEKRLLAGREGPDHKSGMVRMAATISTKTRDVQRIDLFTVGCHLFGIMPILRHVTEM